MTARSHTADFAEILSLERRTSVAASRKLFIRGELPR